MLLRDLYMSHSLLCIGGLGLGSDEAASYTYLETCNGL